MAGIEPVTESRKSIVLTTALPSRPLTYFVSGVAQWVECWSLTGELSVACTLTCSWRVTSLWVYRLLYVSQHGQLSHSSSPVQKMSSKLNLGICCYVYMRGGTIWGMLYEL